MEFRPLSLMVFLLVLVVGHASRDIDDKFILPDDSLINDGSTSFMVGKLKTKYKKYSDTATDQEIMAMRTMKLFFLEHDMRPGKSVNLHISKDTTTTPQFTSQQVIDKCESVSKRGKDHYCMTSYESMVNFASSKLGKSVKAISTQVEGKESTPLQGYKVEEVKKMNGDNVVVCHQEYSTYAGHYCHYAPKVNAYMVSLVGENYVKAKAISVCHEDTASWNPKHIAFQVLTVKPGTNGVCHFLTEDDIAWVSY